MGKKRKGLTEPHGHQRQHSKIPPHQQHPQLAEFADVPFVDFQKPMLDSACAALERAVQVLLPLESSQIRERPLGNFLLGEFVPITQAELAEERASEVYQANLKLRARLPAFRDREKIGEFIRNRQVTLIVGATGCGKSTQIPQIILEDAIDRGEPCRILISQPRRIAAVSLAERVAWERGGECGDRIAYKIRFEDVANSYSQVVFCTAGLLLKLLHSNPTLKGCTHIIVDEVHERGLQTDFLMLLLRRVIAKRQDLKVLLMSATINPTEFLDYFPGAGLMEIEGSTIYPIEEIFLEQLLPYVMPLTPPVCKGLDPTTTADGLEVKPEALEAMLKCSEYVAQYISAFHQKPHDYVDLALIEAVVTHIHHNRSEGGILIFVPGIAEIIAIQQHFLKVNFADELCLFPMHSTLPTIQQKLVFEPVAPGKRKVVISTSLAETSITIEDIVYVVDTGKERSIFLNNALVNTLRTAWYSKANAFQRRGRAGRCRAGAWYRLYTSLQWETFPDTTLPEMVKLSLEDLCLQVSALGFGSPLDFLQEALSAPPQDVVSHSLAVLYDLGALTDITGAVLTPLGEKLSRLHLHPILGKMLLLSALFRCVQPITVICAALGYKSPFLAPLDQGRECAKFKQDLSAGSLSDHVTLVNAYHQWCHSNLRSDFICDVTMGYLHDAVHELVAGSTQLLDYLPTDHRDPSLMAKALRAVLVAGLSPNLALVDNRGKGWAHRNMQVHVHPGSVNCRIQNGSPLGSWVAYYQLQVTKMPYLYDCTVVDIAPCLLFAPSLQVISKGQTKVLLQMGPWRLAVSYAVSNVILKLRRLWTQFLNLSVGESLRDIHFQTTTTLLSLFGVHGNCPLLTRGDLLVRKKLPAEETPQPPITNFYAPPVKSEAPDVGRNSSSEASVKQERSVTPSQKPIPEERVTPDPSGSSVSEVSDWRGSGGNMSSGWEFDTPANGKSANSQTTFSIDPTSCSVPQQVPKQVSLRGPHLASANGGSNVEGTTAAVNAGASVSVRSVASTQKPHVFTLRPVVKIEAGPSFPRSPSRVLPLPSPSTFYSPSAVSSSSSSAPPVQAISSASTTNSISSSSPTSTCVNTKQESGVTASSGHVKTVGSSTSYAPDSKKRTLIESQSNSRTVRCIASRSDSNSNVRYLGAQSSTFGNNTNIDPEQNTNNLTRQNNNSVNLNSRSIQSSNFVNSVYIRPSATPDTRSLHPIDLTQTEDVDDSPSCDWRAGQARTVSGNGHGLPRLSISTGARRVVSLVDDEDVGLPPLQKPRYVPSFAARTRLL